jgi:outer membrane protein assembly factor BamB
MAPGDVPILIDLGEDWSAPEPTAPARRRPRSPGSVRAPRSLRVLPTVALAAVLLLLVGGAEAGQRLRPLGVLKATQVATVALSPDSTFVGDHGFATTSDRDLYGAVSAYRLRGGAPRWRTTVPQVPQQLQYLADASVVVATAVYGPDNLMLTVVLDAATGRQLWTTDSGLLADAPGDGKALLAGYAGGTVQWVDLRTGHKIWSHPAPPNAEIRVARAAEAADPGLVVLLTPDGTVDVLAERTGAVVAAGGVGVLDVTDGQLGLPGDPAAPGVDVLGGVLLVFRPRLLGPSSLTAYDLAGMSPLWTKTRAYRGYATACGALVCLPDDSGLAGVDPRTGAEVWRNPDWRDASAIDADRLLAFADRSGDETAVLDAGTGQVLSAFGGWSVVSSEPGARMFARPSASGDGSAWFATLDPGRRAPTVLGGLPATAFESCWTDAGLLACRTDPETIRIWRYRS